MYSQVEKPKENRSRAIANSVSQKKIVLKQGFGLVDNRPEAVAQRKLKDDLLSSFSNQPRNIPAQLVKGNYGNSAKLAKARYSLSHKKQAFKDWKRGREAQHLIPAAICDSYGIPEAWANGVHNGMMMPSGRPKTHHLRIKALDKGKRAHIKKGWAHPIYNKYVENQVKTRGWKKGKVTKIQFLALAGFLRKKNRPKKTGTTKGHVDDIK